MTVRVGNILKYRFDVFFALIVMFVKKGKWFILIWDLWIGVNYTGKKVNSENTVVGVCIIQWWGGEDEEKMGRWWSTVFEINGEVLGEEFVIDNVCMSNASYLGILFLCFKSSQIWFVSSVVGKD
jgi:hypothetical protein